MVDAFVKTYLVIHFTQVVDSGSEASPQSVQIRLRRPFIRKYLGLSYSRGQTLTAIKGILPGMKGIPGINQGLYVKDNADQSFCFCHGPTRTNADKINFLEADPEKVKASRPPLSVWVRGY
jgi:hypothetical protein